MSNQPSRFQAGGYTLVELLAVIAIMVALTVAAVPGVVGIMKGGNFTSNLNEVADCLQQARAAAMARNSYVWVGVLSVSANAPGNAGGPDKVLLAAVVGKNGQSSDLVQGNTVPLARGRVLKNVDLQQYGAQILASSGRQTGADDISASALGAGATPYQFTCKIGSETVGGQMPTFTKLIQFGPIGNARIMTTASRWIEIGMQASPDAKGAIGILQINGITGQVRIFRP
jgi:Tfp pilus assembly protein FimT